MNDTLVAIAALLAAEAARDDGPGGAGFAQPRVDLKPADLARDRQG